MLCEALPASVRSALGSRVAPDGRPMGVAARAGAEGTSAWTLAPPAAQCQAWVVRRRPPRATTNVATTSLRKLLRANITRATRAGDRRDQTTVDLGGVAAATPPKSDARAPRRREAFVARSRLTKDARSKMPRELLHAGSIEPLASRSKRRGSRRGDARGSPGGPPTLDHQEDAPPPGRS